MAKPNSVAGDRLWWVQCRCTRDFYTLLGECAKLAGITKTRLIEESVRARCAEILANKVIESVSS